MVAVGSVQPGTDVGGVVVEVGGGGVGVGVGVGFEEVPAISKSAWSWVLSIQTSSIQSSLV